MRKIGDELNGHPLHAEAIIIRSPPGGLDVLANAVQTLAKQKELIVFNANSIELC